MMDNDDFIAEEHSFRYFTADGLKHLHQLMANIGASDLNVKDERNAFLAFIQKPFVEPLTKHIAAKFHGIDPELMKEAVNQQLFRLVRDTQNPRYFKGSERSWAYFAMDFHNSLKLTLTRKLDQQCHDLVGRQSLIRDVVDCDYRADPRELAADNELNAVVKRYIANELTPKQAEVLLDRYLNNEETLEAIAKRTGVSHQAVESREKSAIGRLRKKASSWGLHIKESTVSEEGREK